MDVGVELDDGTVRLRPLRPDDAAAHLAGQDAALARWLDRGWSTPQTVRDHLERVAAAWAAGGPDLGFGVRLVADDVLVGTLDVQLRPPYATAEQANLAFGLYPPWRGHGLATRAVLLAVRFLAEHQPDVSTAVLRIDPDSPASAAVAWRAGFTPAPRPVSDDSGLDWYVRTVR